jgi:hypothetical protein
MQLRPCSRVGLDVLHNDDDLPVRARRDRIPDSQAVRRPSRRTAARGGLLRRRPRRSGTRCRPGSGRRGCRSFRRGGQDAGGQVGVCHEVQGSRHHHSDGGRGLMGFTANANASARRIAVARSWQPSTGDQGKVDRRPQDGVGEEGGLVGAGRGHHQQVLLQRHMEAVPVVGPAQKHRVLPGVQEPASQRQVRADPAGAAQGSQAAPAQVQAEQVGEAQVSDGNDAVTVLTSEGSGCRPGSGTVLTGWTRAGNCVGRR